MSARPPPARPHIGLNPSNRFGTYSISDWGEDDAWDSASDEEASAAAPWKGPRRQSSTSTAPKPVPKSKANSSSSTLASSYTHVNAPSPSSYPPRTEQPIPAKQGWTIVRTASSSAHAPSYARETPREHSDDHTEHEGEGDLILGEMDTEEVPAVEQHPDLPPPTKQRHGQGVVREDIEEIVKGTTLLCMYSRCSPLTLS